MWSAALILSFLQAIGLIMAQDLRRLRKTLAAGDVHTLFPGDNGYPQAAQACKLFLSGKLYRVYSMFCTDNGRFIIEPIAIAYPRNADQVSTAIKAGAEQNIRVVSRSGGVSYYRPEAKSRCDYGHSTVTSPTVLAGKMGPLSWI